MAKARGSRSNVTTGARRHGKDSDTATKKPRAPLDVEYKAEILKQHLFDKKPVSDLCARHGLQPSVVYYWQRQARANLAAALKAGQDDRRRTRRERALIARIAALESMLKKKNEFIDAIGKDNVAQKKQQWGSLKGRWVPQHVRDEVVDFVTEWSEKTDLPVTRLVKWLNISKGKFYQWKKKKQRGKTATRSGRKPRDRWLQTEEHQAIIDYYRQHPHVDYRRLTYMMLDDNVAAVSPSTTYRVLRNASVLKAPSQSSQRGFRVPRSDAPHHRWHIVIVRLDVAGTRRYLCAMIDCHSRAFVHWNICQAMTGRDIEVLVQQAMEHHGVARPQLSGTSSRPRDLAWFVDVIGPGHRPFTRAIRSIQEARAMVADLISYYNHVRLHSAVGYVTPDDKLHGRDKAIWEHRERKIEDARARRRLMHRDHYAAA